METYKTLSHLRQSFVRAKEVSVWGLNRLGYPVVQPGHRPLEYSNTREMGKVAVGQGMRKLRMLTLDRVRDGYLDPRTGSSSSLRLFNRAWRDHVFPVETYKTLSHLRQSFVRSKGSLSLEGLNSLGYPVVQPG